MYELRKAIRIKEIDRPAEAIRSLKQTLIWYGLGALTYTILALIYFNK
jgi:hypothetical protein